MKIALFAVIPTGVIVECSRCVTVSYGIPNTPLENLETFMAMKKLIPLGNSRKATKADSDRKTKQAQSINMGKVKAKKSAMADSKRKTAEAKTFPPAKKAPSSYALGLIPKKKIQNFQEKRKP